MPSVLLEGGDHSLGSQLLLSNGSSRAGWREDGGDCGRLHWSPAHPRPGSHGPHGDLPTQHHPPVCAGESRAGGQERFPQHLLFPALLKWECFEAVWAEHQDIFGSIWRKWPHQT